MRNKLTLSCLLLCIPIFTQAESQQQYKKSRSGYLEHGSLV